MSNGEIRPHTYALFWGIKKPGNALLSHSAARAVVRYFRLAQKGISDWYLQLLFKYNNLLPQEEKK